MRTIAFILALVVALGATGQNSNPLLYNLATSGLYLRSQPKAQSRAITKIPYGTKVEVLEKTGIFGKSGWIEDEWLKVHFRGRSGYVFAGYLSQLQAPEKENTLGRLSDVLAAYAGTAFIAKEQAIETVEGRSLHCYQPFSGQIELETETQDGWSTTILTIPSNDLFDSYILLEALLYWNNDLALLDSLRFVKGKDGKIDRISDPEGQVRITKASVDRVQLSISDQAE